METRGYLSLALAAAFLVFCHKPRMDSDSLQRRVNGTDGLAYVWIPPGSFQMGCSPGDTECDDDEAPAKSVTIAKGFRLGESEVTQAAYKKVTGRNPSHFAGSVDWASRPVEQVTWDDARSYCHAIGGRLPTEAEWEYSARAGTKGARYGAPDSVAWYDSNSGPGTHPVKQKEPNAWGLYDMLGNIDEWVEDPYPGTDGQTRIMRGGSFGTSVREARASSRNGVDPSFRADQLGFRCAGD